MAMPIVPSERPPSMLHGKQNPAYGRWYRAIHRAQKQATDKAYREKHRESLLAYFRAYYAEHKAENNARSRQYRLDHPEEMQAYFRQHYLEHCETIKARVRAYNAANPEQSLERARRYRAEHPEVCRALQKRKRARKKNAPINDLTAAQWREIKAAYGYCCVYCGRKMERLTQDHITPFSKGGSHTVSNVVPACQTCNSRKKDGAVLCPVQPLLLTLS